jgi:hypothetical protein
VANISVMKMAKHQPVIYQWRKRSIINIANHHWRNVAQRIEAENWRKASA